MKEIAHTVRLIMNSHDRNISFPSIWWRLERSQPRPKGEMQWKKNLMCCHLYFLNTRFFVLRFWILSRSVTESLGVNTAFKKGSNMASINRHLKGDNPRKGSGFMTSQLHMDRETILWTAATGTTCSGYFDACHPDNFVFEGCNTRVVILDDVNEMKMPILPCCIHNSNHFHW